MLTSVFVCNIFIIKFSVCFTVICWFPVSATLLFCCFVVLLHLTINLFFGAEILSLKIFFFGGVPASYAYDHYL